MPATVILGDEYDQPLRATVMTVLQQLGASLEKQSWGVGGSQEIEIMQICLHGHDITIEAETYIGLSITGEETLIREISERVRQAMVSGDKPSEI